MKEKTDCGIRVAENLSRACLLGELAMAVKRKVRSLNDKGYEIK